MTEYVTHFLGDEHSRTLCGLPITAIIDNERPPTCVRCRETHSAVTGWSFPLPLTVAVD